jgi:hypothetical protein
MLWTLVEDRDAKFRNAFYIILQYDTKILSTLSTYSTDKFNKAHVGGKVVSPMHRPPLSVTKYSWSSFLLEAESTPGSQRGRKDYVIEKSPVTPSGNKLATFRLVAQCPLCVYCTWWSIPARRSPDFAGKRHQPNIIRNLSYDYALFGHPLRLLSKERNSASNNNSVSHWRYFN